MSVCDLETSTTAYVCVWSRDINYGVWSRDINYDVWSRDINYDVWSRDINYNVCLCVV